MITGLLAEGQPIITFSFRVSIFVGAILFIGGILGWCAQASAESEARSVFDQAAASVYQILIIEAESGNKSAIGSGFQLADSDLVATNFHVVSDALHKPEKYRIEYLDTTGKRGVATLVDFDVVHDLALLRRDTAAIGGLSFSMSEINKGDSVYSLGNPYDLGQTIIPGTYNGLLERSFYQKLLFSGSLNPGMSGGPSLNEAGEIIGVNVATSGNQISFLVPAKYLVALKDQAMARAEPLQAAACQKTRRKPCSGIARPLNRVMPLGSPAWARCMPMAKAYQKTTRQPWCCSAGRLNRARSLGRPAWA